MKRLTRHIRDSSRACALTIRSRNLRRAQLSFGAMWAGEWAVMVTIGVVAFRHGGAAAVGLVALLRMAPAALLPALSADPRELTCANVTRGLLDSLATLLGPLGAALLLGVSGPAAALAACSGVSLWAGAIV